MKVNIKMKVKVNIDDKEFYFRAPFFLRPAQLVNISDFKKVKMKRDLHL